MKTSARPLLDRAIESLTLAIEIFNRPSAIARCHAVLILLQHAFEMLLKAVIFERGETVYEKGERYTYGFARCLSVSCDGLGVITSDERTTLKILDAQRDQAAHYYVELSEEMLYVHAQAAVTLFAKVLSDVFGVALATRIPNRVLPVSAHPPRDLTLLLGAELEVVDALLGDRKRSNRKASARLRSVMAFSSGSRGEGERVSTTELSDAIARRRQGQTWDVIFPEIAQLRLATEGSGVPIEMRITKDAGLAVRVARDGDAVVGTIIRQEVNIWDKYNLSRDDLAKKIGLTGPKTLALIYELGVQSDPECFHVMSKGKSTFKGYSKKALDQLREAVRDIDIADVWSRHRHRFGARLRRS